VIGRDDNGVPYLIRYRLFNIGIHFFKQGDNDPDPHDHPYDFWTFPLHSYVEEVYEPSTGATFINIVPAWRWTFRKAEYCHRILGKYSGLDEYAGYDGPQINEEPFTTIVIFGKRRRDWGFWHKRVWIFWRRYGQDTSAPTLVD
jgi:hypothetical protein